MADHTELNSAGEKLEISIQQSSRTSPAYQSHNFFDKILKELGTFLVPGSVIGIIGVLFGASQIQIATSTIATVLLLYVTIYRNFINKTIPSYLILASLIVSASFLFVFQTRCISLVIGKTIGGTTGIVEFQSKANDFLPRLSNFITDAKEEIWFTGISFYITLPANKDRILKKLEQGITTKFLIYNPFSDNITDVASGFGQTKDELFAECDVTIQNLRTILIESQTRHTKAHLEVKLFSSIPKSRIYVFDRHLDEGYTYFIPHVDQQNSPNLPGFLVKNINTGIAPAYFEGIERLWNNAADFDSFLKEYDQRRKRQPA